MKLFYPLAAIANLATALPYLLSRDFSLDLAQHHHSQRGDVLEVVLPSHLPATAAAALQARGGVRHWPDYTPQSSGNGEGDGDEEEGAGDRVTAAAVMVGTRKTGVEGEGEGEGAGFSGDYLDDGKCFGKHSHSKRRGSDRPRVSGLRLKGKMRPSRGTRRGGRSDDGQGVACVFALCAAAAVALLSVAGCLGRVLPGGSRVDAGINQNASMKAATVFVFSNLYSSIF